MDALIKMVVDYTTNESGINQEIVTEKSLAKAIQNRMLECKISETIKYYQRLTESKEEFQLLIDSFIVPETWFFRTPKSFDHLKQYVLSNYFLKRKYKKISILCLGCSSGEEPFSIAMSLLDVGVPPNDFNIEAFDICEKSLEKGRGGVFGNHSFHGKDLTFKKRYFKKKGLVYEIDETVRQQVHLKYGNVNSPHFVTSKLMYSIIFCRNLFIYLNPRALKRVYQMIDRLLEPGGLLFVGAADIELAKKIKHLNLYSKEGFVFCKDEKKEKTVEIKPKKREKIELPVNVMTISKNSPLPNQPQLEEIFKLADKGQFDEAYPMCLDYVKNHKNESKAYFLLGFIHFMKENDDQAKKCFTKALYIDPKHYDSLIYSALLEDKRGNTQKAELFRKRAKKALSP